MRETEKGTKETRKTKEETAGSAGSDGDGHGGGGSSSSSSSSSSSEGNERLRDAVAAWVRSADAATTDAEDRAGSEKRTEEAADNPQEGPGGTTGAETASDTSEAAEEPVATSGGQSTEEAPAPPGASGSPGSLKDPKALGIPETSESPSNGPDAAEPEATGAAADTAEPEAVGAPGAVRTEADGPDTGADAHTDAGADAATATGRPAPDTTRAATTAGAETDTDTDADADADAQADAEDATPEAGADPDDAPGTGERPVDQPTAAFKAVRPSAPAVDQPTTMLKLGGAAEDAAEDDKDETSAERTSRFVALKPLDDPATRQPPPASDATTALPRAPRPPAPAPSVSAAPPKAPAKAPANAPAKAPADATAAVRQVGPERTTQQPLPPKPPMDLLAELTNTPPPPQTPLRTAVRRVKIWTPLVLLLVIVFGVVQSMRPLPEPQLDLTAQESFDFEGGKPQIPWPDSGQAALDVQGIGTFGSSGEQKPVPIASVAKVMTAYVILRDHPLKSGDDGPKIEIDQTAEDQSQAGQESTVDVFAGDSITQREALESILIASANNVARLLARWDAGSEEAFVEKMNAAAEELGMTDTTYTDPSGLNDTTVSTAVDQVKLAKAAMEQPVFREVAAMMSYVDYKGATHHNWNRLVGSNGVVGIKTGTTTSALGNLVFAAKKEVGGETRTIVGAVVRQPAGGPDNTIIGAALHESDQLIRAAQGALESATIIKKGDVVGYVDDGLGGRTPVVATQDVKAVGWSGLTVKLTFTADDVPHTAKAGTEVGALTVGDGGSSGAVKVPVALQKDLVEPAFTDRLTRLG
ncbi:D-alanyl-D-alanine carboxypeptidase [Streptomyces poriticola]|uniref:D-alanyl-D-alanine carboxypeptidase n=1 Tax=Streptomyces poriticola TaxID=3120506 RepID=UPI0038CD5E47